MAKKLPRGFYWRGGVIWVRTDPITGKPCSTRCRSRSAAELWREERERLAASPTYAASVRATVGGWVAKTIAHKRARGKSDGTLHMYETKLGHVNRIFGASSPMAVITPAAVDAYIAQRKTERAVNNTIARELTCLRQLLRLARREGEFNLEPAAVMPVGFASGYVPVKRTLDVARLGELLAALPEDRRAWVCYALSTAGDVSDVERAQPEDYDPATETVQMRGTKNRARTVAIPVLPWLRHLFLYAHERLPVAPWPRVSKDLPAITTKLGLGHVTPKDLRRSVCTWLVEAGVPEELASRFMRHRDGKMVRTVYGQVKPQALGLLIAGQLQSKNVTETLGPLGGMADAGDLKAAAASPRRPKSAKQHDPNRGDEARSGVVGGTDSLHRLSVAELELLADSEVAA
jgi:integrase